MTSPVFVQVCDIKFTVALKKNIEENNRLFLKKKEGSK